MVPSDLAWLVPLKDGTLSKEVATAFFVEMILPFDLRGETKLTQTLVKQIEAQSNWSECLEEISILVRSIRRIGCSDAKTDWLEGVEDGLYSVRRPHAEVGIRDADFPSSERYRASGHFLEFADGRKALRKESVRRIVSSMDDLEHYVTTAKDETHFDWSEVATNLISDLKHPEDLVRLIELTSTTSSSGTIRTEVSRRLTDLGYASKAWAVAYDALRRSRNWDWV